MNSTEVEIWMNWAQAQIRGLRKVLVLLQPTEVYEWESGEIRLLLTDQEAGLRMRSFVQQLKSSKWLNEDEIPLQRQEERAIPGQLSLSRESGVNVLALRSQETDTVIVLFFDVPSRHFGMSVNEKNFSASNRKIMEQLLTSSMNQYALHLAEQKKFEEKMHDYQLYLVEKVKQAQEKIRISEMVQQQNREALILQVFREAAFNRKIKVHLSKEAKELMAAQTEDLSYFQHLAEHILDHLRLINRLQDNLIIEEPDVEWVMKEMKKVPEPEQDSAVLLSPIGRLSRTRQLLDRYEDAARIAVYHQEEITGKNIARYCNPPVTNASISDALKKHRERIIELLQSDKNSWPLLRSRFKSMHRLAESEADKRHSA